MPTITNQGAVPIPPTTLLQNEIDAAVALAPGLTTDLPGSLVEDMASTATGATVVIDQATTDLINSISPTTANGALLYQLGYMYGVQRGIAANTSVYVTFISPDIGFTISPGFTVSDGTNQYTVQSGAIINSSGQSDPVFCLSVTEGIFSVPVGTVTQIITSLPSTITMTCINLVAGVPGEEAQSEQDYRYQVIQAGQATAQGVPQFLKTQLNKVSGVQSNLVSVRPSGTMWEVIVGGGDPYEVANAIYKGVPDIANLVGSTLKAVSITNAYPALVTTDLNHGYSSGQVMQFSGATGMTGINGTPFVARVISDKTFNLNVGIATLTWSAGVVTVTTNVPHNLPFIPLFGNIYDAFPIAYNGNYLFTRTGTLTFTYPLVTDPGVATPDQGYTDFYSIINGPYTPNSAILTPNLRNIVVSINDYPDIYDIPFVNPPQQTVIVNLAWNTISTNFVSDVAIANAGSIAIANYINGIGVGQPINIFAMEVVFEDAIANLLDIRLISKMIFTVAINGVVTPPNINTGVIYGDPESYFNTNSSQIIIIQS